MSSNYSIDDILAEVNQKKRERTGEPAREERKASTPSKVRRDPAPFQLSGITLELPSVTTASVKTAQHKSPRSYSNDENFSTKVIPAVTADAALEERRRKKVAEFLTQSPKNRDDSYEFKKKPDMAEQENDELDELDDDENDGISQFFKGFKSREKDNDSDYFEPTSPSSFKGKSSTKTKKSKLDKQSKKPRHEKNEKASANKGTEYRSTADSMPVFDELDKIQRILNIRIAVNVISFLIVLYLSLCNLSNKLPLLTIIVPEGGNMQIYLLANLFVLIFSAMFSASIIGSGLVSLFTLKANQDTPVSICVIAVIVHTVACVVSKDFIVLEVSYFYPVVPALVLLINSMGKKLSLNRVQTNFSLLNSQKALKGEYLLEDTPLAHAITNEQDLETPTICYKRPISFPKNFISLSYTDDYSASIHKIISPIFLGFAFIISVLSLLLFEQSGMQALTIFTVIICIASPLTTTIIGSLPLLRAATTLSKEGALISGYDAVDSFNNADSVIIDASELYPSKSVTVHGVKAFEAARVDNAIIQAASVMMETNGILKNAFLDIIGGKTSMLQPVSDIHYYSDGIAAKVNSESVIVGSSRLLRTFGIEPMTAEYEKKFIKSGKNLLYISDGKMILAMFILTYAHCEKAEAHLNNLLSKETGILVKTFDPNITTSKIALDFDYPEEYISIIPIENFEEVDELLKDNSPGDAFIITTGTTSSLRLLSAVFAVRKSILLATMMQSAFLVLGYAITTYLAFTGNIHYIGFLELMIFQIISALFVIAIPNMKKI